MSESLEEIKKTITEARVHGIYNWNTETIASLITTIESQNSQIESLKAITELAVKGLEYVLTFPFLESTEDSRVIKRSCSDYLAKIERLTNAHIQPKSPS